jgi:hypothetical protein
MLHISKDNTKCIQKEYENTKSVNRSKMDKSKKTKEQIMIYKTQRKKDRVTLTTLATGGEFGFFHFCKPLNLINQN